MQHFPTSQFTNPTHLLSLCAMTAILSSFCFLYPQANIAIGCSVSLTMLIACLLRWQCIKFQDCALILTTIILIAARLYQLQHQYDHLQNYLEKPTIVAGIIEQIQHNAQERATTSLLIKTKSMYTQSVGNQKPSTLILVQLPTSRAKYLKIGQNITFYKLILTRPCDNNPYAQYLQKQHIWATSFLTDQRFFVARKNSSHWYEKIFTKLERLHDKPVSYLYNPLFLGKKEKDSCSLEMQHLSTYWGIAHHMARSGIHLVTLIGFFIVLFHYARIRTRFRFLIYLLLAIFYWHISIDSISFLRSLTMIAIQMITKFHKYQYSSIHAFALTTLLFVMHNPLLVLFLDFQLSFGITGCIIGLFLAKRRKTIADQTPVLAHS
jgi:ComEC/Rec2-related protein